MMASVNKQSLREEFDTLKAEFERLTANGRMAAESRALFQAMLMLFEVLMAVFMEKRTAKDNRNSSLPSSQTAKEDNTATQPGAKGKGKSQNDALSGNTRTVEGVQIAPVNQCGTCGEDLSDTPCQGHERRTRIDIIFEKVVSHRHRLEPLARTVIAILGVSKHGPCTMHEELSQIGVTAFADTEQTRFPASTMLARREPKRGRKIAPLGKHLAIYKPTV